MKKRLLSALLVLCMLLSILPAAVFAATAYDLYINEFQFTSDKLTYTGESGTAVYDPSTRTLTLNSLTVSTSQTNGIIWSEIPGLTVLVNGTTTVNLKDSNPNSGGDVAQQTNFALYLDQSATIRGKNGNKSTDRIVINSKTSKIDASQNEVQLDHNTYRVGIYTPDGAQLSVENVTLSMTDSSTGGYLGSAALLYIGGALTVTGSKLATQSCGLGIYMGNEKSATVKNTEFDMKLAGDSSSGLNFSAGSDNRVENPTGTIEATYPLYTYGTATVTGTGKLTLKATGSKGMAAVSKRYSTKYTAGKLIFDNANIEMYSDYYGIQLEASSSAVIRGGIVSVTANIGVNVKDSSGSFALESGKLNLTGTGSYPVGINTYGKVAVSGGELAINDSYAAIQNIATEALSFTGGTHTINATLVGYVDNTVSTLDIGGTAKVTINAPTGIQLSKGMGGKLNLTGGELNLICTKMGLRLQSGAGKATFSGGKLGITGSGETLAEYGIYIANETEFSGTEVTVRAMNGIYLETPDGASKSSKLSLTDGKIELNCTSTALTLMRSAGKTTLSGGTLNINDVSEEPTATGIYAAGETEFGGTNVNFTGCKFDIRSDNAANKMTGGKLSLTASSFGMQLFLGFEMTDGEIVANVGSNAIAPLQGTTTLKGGKLNLTAGLYPIYLANGGILDFAGAEVYADSGANYALVVTDGCSYKITGGSIILKSKTYGSANQLYTEIPENYGVWAGADEASAQLLENPVKDTFVPNKYVRIAENHTYTLTLVNVKEGTSAALNGGAAFTYTAKDAANGQHFSHWELTVNGTTTTVGTDSTYSGKMPASDATLTAVYENCHGGTATCTTQATCEVCGKPYGDLAAHSFTAETVEEKYLKSAADCDNAAVYYKSCTGCGATSKDTEHEATFASGKALGHDWGAWKSNGNGTHTHTCSRNSEHTETKDCHGGTADCTHKAVCADCKAEYGSTADHNYAAETVDEKYLKSAADCDNAAVYYKSCTGCGATSKGTDGEATFSSGKALGHDWGAWKSNCDGTHTRTCSRDSSHTENGSCHGGAADCTHKAVCTDCKAEYGSTADHNYAAETVDEKYLKSAADCDNAAVYYKSCTGCGATSKGTDGEATFESGTALGHDWGAWKSNSNGTHTHTCSRNAAHTETKDCHGGTADCTHKAVCADCKAEYGELGYHNEQQKVEEKYLRSPANCTEAATYYYSCSGCGKSMYELGESDDYFEDGEPLGHDEVVDTGKAPTCTESGLSDGKHCARCDEILVEQTELPALGHDITEGTVTKQPTCTEYGEIVGTCTRCGKENVTGKIDKLAHTEEDIAEVAATCTENGWSAGKHCTVCGEYTEGHELLDPLGHTLRTLPETDTLTEGQECSVCGEIVIPQLTKLTSRWTDDGNYDAELYASAPGNWVLYDAADLAAYAKKINDGGSFAGYTVTLANDIDLSGHIWVPIGVNHLAYTEENFTGTFDGAMHTIRGMYAEHERCAALFAKVVGGGVLNVTVSGDVRLSTRINDGSNYAAGLIAMAYNTVVRNCGFIGTVSLYAPNASFAQSAAGLIAELETCTVENCFAIATIYGSTGSTLIAGGLVADASSFVDDRWTELRGCYTACQFYVGDSREAFIGKLAAATYWSTSFTDCYVQSANTFGYTAKMNGHGNLTYTTLPTAGMTDPDVLLAALNRYVAQSGSPLCNAWLLDPAVNGGYPFYGLSVWFKPNVEGAETALQALRSGETATAATLDIKGYRLEGWYADADFATEFDFTKPITANTVVYGKYLSNTYQITYVLNGGENAAANPTEFLYGVGAALADPTRENYIFDGWYTDADFANKVTEIAADTAQSITLYAKWTLDPNHPHVYGVCKVGSDGLHDRTCTLCGKDFDCEYTQVVVAPTCTSAGYTVHTCAACGNSYIDTIVEGSHNWSTTVVAPTHTEMGYTLYTCSACGESYKTDYTAPVGHTFDEGKVTKPATCTEDGEMTYTCSCGETHTAPIAKTGHSWDNGKVVSAATLTETGKLIQTCTVCGEIRETVIPMLTACDGGEGCPSTAYTDVPDAQNWAHVGIDFVLKSGLFYGTSDTTFEPEGAMTRAMLVTVLHRLEGQPKSAAENPFTDVENGTWYTDAVIWAAENGIVDGIGGGLFDPDGEITREQMATILYRYSEFKGLTPTEGAFTASYPDEGEISAYAVKAMRWANTEKLINGTELDGIVCLDPQGSATRAQVAAILMRYVQNVLS